MSTELQYREILPQRDVAGAAFSRGVQNFLWSVGSPTSFIPSKSYLRFDVVVTRSSTNDEQPQLKDLIAPADNACGNLYNNAAVYAGGQMVSQIVTGLPQASALKTRLLASAAQQESIGSSAMLSEGEFAKRQQAVCSDAQLSSLSDDYELRPLTTVVANQRSATVAVAANGGAVTGVNTTLAIAAPGDTLVVAGQRFQFTAVASPTQATVSPAPSGDINATANAYIVKQRPRVSQGANKFYVIWRPPLGFFDIDGAMPAGDYRLALNPSADYKSAAIESLLGSDAQPTPATNYDFKINSVSLYLATIKTAVPRDFIAPLYEINVQSKPFSGTNSASTLNFTIPSSTKAISVWVQADAAGSNPLIPPSMFKTFAGTSERPYLNLESIQLTYANLTKPSTRWSSGYGAGINLLQQRYHDTYNEAGMLGGAGGVERFEEYLERGPVYHFSWERDVEDASTELQVTANYAGGGLPAGSSIFVAAWYSRSISISSSGGMVREVQSRVA